MTGHDVYLLSPEISLVGLALLVMGLDLVVSRKGLLTLVAVAGLALPLALSIVLWGDVSSEADGRLVGVMGALSVDKFALFFKFLILGVTGLLLAASVDYARRLPGLRGEFIGLILLSATGMLLLASATELITLYVALELSALPMIALVTFRMTSRSGEAGLKFLVLSGVSSALLLYGMVLVYGFTGTTYLAEIGAALATSPGGGVPFGGIALLVGVILIVAGFGFKISAAPFHMWAPDVYQGGPTPVVAFLSVASKAAGFAILLRVFYTAFPSAEMDWSMLFAILAVVSMTLGNLMAMVQTNIKRLLAYSTVAHAGYMLVGLAAVASRIDGGGIAAGPGSLLFYLGAYAVTNLAAFFVVMAVANRLETREIDDYSGLSHRSPFLAGALAFALVSLIGIPPTGLFIGKIFLFTSAVQSGLAWLAVAGVINSVISAYYYLRVVRLMYTGEPSDERKVGISPVFGVALAISAGAVLALGVAPRLITWLTDGAARVLLG